MASRIAAITLQFQDVPVLGYWLSLAPRTSCLVPNFVVVIPARYASVRLPGKALADIAGKPMVVHVADRGRESGAREVIVATDDSRIQQAVAQHGHTALMTRSDHVSGTDRIAEIAAARAWQLDRDLSGDRVAQIVVKLKFITSRRASLGVMTSIA